MVTYLTQLRIHLTTHSDGKPYHCTICWKSFSRSKHFEIQMKNHPLNKCDICTSSNLKLTCLTQLRIHLINHMDGKPYHCTICGKNFSKSKHLAIHMNIYSWNKYDACMPGNFQCTCWPQLRMQLINHVDGKPYHCTVCGKRFSKSKHLVIHMKHHSWNKCYRRNFEFTCLT